MGSWNGTCMVSGLPIVYGDSIVCLIIKQNTSGTWGSECYCYAEAQLVSHPIYGEYNDYGGIQNIEDNPDNEELLEFLKKNLIPSEGHSLGVDTDNQYRHFKKQETLEATLNDSIERGYAALKSFRPQYTKAENGEIACIMNNYVAAPVTLTFIHREIWDHIMEDRKTKTTYTGETYSDFIMNKIKKWINPQVNEDDVKHITKDGKISVDEAIEMYKKFLISERNPLNSHDGFCGVDAENMTVNNIYKILMLTNYLEEHRLNIRPQTGKGHQASEYEGHIKLHEKIIEIANNKLKLLNEDDEDDEKDLT